MSKSSPQYQKILQQRRYMERLGNKDNDPIFNDGATAFNAGKTLEDNPYGTRYECYKKAGLDSDLMCDRTLWQMGWQAMSDAMCMGAKHLQDRQLRAAAIEKETEVSHG